MGKPFIGVIGKRKGVKVRCRELTGMGWTSNTYNSVSQAKKHNLKKPSHRFTCKRVDNGKVVWKK